MALKGLEHDAQDKIPRDIKKKLQDVSQLLHKSLRLNNIMFTEIQRKRKSDICQSLGEKFKHRRAAVTGTKATNTTTNGESTDWGKRTIEDIWHQYTRIKKNMWRNFNGVIYPQKFLIGRKPQKIKSS